MGKTMVGKLGVAITAVALGWSAVADGYRFIVSDNSENECKSCCSPAIAFCSSALGRATEAQSLEARFRSLQASDPIFLNTFPTMGCLLIFR